ncbi:sigma-70 family RNA polymerase sigma factor [uncultured Aquimarina sp.]|uniref:RNA polymerase sigma factor n=1 Tax=uncultured Aquimarina sp. TaxID=575652 RepID=UPI002604C529|nr:sigma-70 family RNA polymerase sigma factor [uncultured Aquimarina sp.]
MIKDQNIIHGIVSGDELIIKEFYQKHLPCIRTYIIKNSGNQLDVEDIFQDAMIILYQKLKTNTLTIETSLSAYFEGVCKNIWRNRLRKNQKIIFDERQVQKCKEKNMIDMEIEQTEKENLYRKYFYKLSKSSKEVLKLFCEGKSMNEISEITGYSKEYTRKKKFEAKKSLIAMIEKDPIHLELKEEKQSKITKRDTSLQKVRISLG